jgi:hypothetical protein
MTIIISEMEENTLIDWDIILAFNHSFANRQLNIEELSLEHWLTGVVNDLQGASTKNR